MALFLFIKRSHCSFLPTGYFCGSVGGALGRLSGSRVEWCLFSKYLARMSSITVHNGIIFIYKKESLLVSTNWLLLWQCWESPWPR